MKKIILISVISLFLFTFLGCENEEIQTQESTEITETTVDENNSEKIKVLTTIYPQYDFAKNIGKDLVDVDMLIKPGMDIHYFEPSPRDIISIEDADLFVYVGGVDEEWVDDALNSMENKPEIIKLMDIVDVYEEEIVEGMEHVHHNEEEPHDHDHEHDHEEETHEGSHSHGLDDEHVWTSLRNAQVISEEISKKLSELSPENKDYFEVNKNEYVQKLDELDQKFVTLFENNQNKPLIFGDRFPFRYFVEDYNLEYYAAFPGCSTEIEPSPQTVSFLIDKSKDLGIETVLKIETSNGQMADSIAEATGGNVKTLHSAHNVTGEEFESGLSYLEIMERNLQVLGEI